MELGSAQHKQLLLNSIIKSSLRIATIGSLIGVLLMIPYILRANEFSSGLFYAGLASVILSLLYAVFLGFKKYQKIIKPFDKQYPSK